MDSVFIEKENVSVPMENVIHSLGVPLEKADDYLKETIATYTNDCMELCNPMAACTVFDEIRFADQNQLMIDCHNFNIGRIVCNALLKSSEIAIFIGTCGSAVENYSKRLINDGHPLEGLVVDIIGSEIAEGVAEYVHRKVNADMSLLKLRITNRYSPGYCNWPVSDQQVLFELMKGNNCGVQLTNSSLMLPVKSVSGIIGIGKLVENSGYTCNVCETEHCIYREKKSLSI